MGNGFALFDIILFAAIAAFLVFRLRGVLGRRTGHDQPPKYDPFRDRGTEESAEEKVIQLPDRGARGEAEDADLEQDAQPSGGTPLEAGLTQIKLADRRFEADGFLSGAKAAFEMVVNGFAEGDTKILRPLLSNDVYEEFSGAIKAREDENQTLETTLIGISEAEVIEAELQSKTAFVTVKFVTEQVNVTRDAEGRVVEGDPNQAAPVTDIWTFARNTRSRDPNWTLVATRSSN
jgi:predicted lipid-binding transport protein (Tim44 family)